jgi:DNA-binding MarR family transcriptional regulator
MAAVPAVMRFIRSQMRGHRQAELSVPQLRSLIFVHLNEDTSVSAMAEHLGLSLPAASRTVELLVNRGLMRRRSRLDDRRKVSLSLTRRGTVAFRAAFRATQTALAFQFKALSLDELAQLSGAMLILSRVFEPGKRRRGTTT